MSSIFTTLELDPHVRSALHTVAGHGLTRAGAGPAAVGPLDDRSWRALLAAVQVERVAPLLDRAVADGALITTASQRENAEAMAAQSLRTVLHLERSLMAVANCLNGESVPFLVLKGPAVARLDELEPALRCYADIDILVQGADVARALKALSTLGYRRDLPERRPGFDQYFGKEVSMANTSGSELDVHRTLALGAFGLRINEASLWSNTAAFDLGGTRLSALAAEGRFVHACLNAVLGDERPRLVALRDVARISSSHRLRSEQLLAIVPAGQGTAVMAAAVASCRSILGVEVGDTAAALASESVMSRWERLALRAYRSQGGSNTLELLSGALGTRGRQRLRYLRAVLTPQPVYRKARSRAGRPREWRTGLREIVGLRSTPLARSGDE